MGRSLYRSLEEVTHFVRACAVEMHFNIFTGATLHAHIQEKCRAPEPRTTLRASLRSRNALMHFNISDFTRATYTEIYRKMPQPSAAQNHGADFVRACEVEMHCNIFTRATLHRNLQEKCRAPEPRTTLCASLRSRNAFQHFTRATLYGNLQEKCHGRKPRRRLCASTSIGNSLPNFTRATFYGNLQEKCRAPAQNADRTLRVRLSNRNVLGDFT